MLQRTEEIALAIRRQRTGHRALVSRAHVQLARIKHRRIVERPLQNIHGVDYRSLPRSFAGFDFALFTASQGDASLRVRQIHFPLENSHQRLQRRRNPHDKLRSAQRSVCGRSVDPHLRCAFAAEKVGAALFQVDRSASLRSAGRTDFENSELVETHHAQIRQANGRAAFSSGFHLVARPKWQLRRGFLPSRACFPRSNVVFGFKDRGLADTRILRGNRADWTKCQRNK